MRLLRFTRNDKSVRLFHFARSDKHVRLLRFTRSDKHVRLLLLNHNHKLKKKCIFLYLVTLDQNLFIKNRNAGSVFLCMIYLFDSFNFSGVLEKPLLCE
jgi:hypothetical protein